MAARVRCKRSANSSLVKSCLDMSFKPSCALRKALAGMRSRAACYRRGWYAGRIVLAHLAFDQCPDLGLELRIFGRELHRDMARARQRVRNNRLDPARTRRHHHDAVRQDERLVDRMRDEDDGLAALLVDAQKLLLHALTRHGIERRKLLIHQ